jgi:radical SAM superfamily enzyme YgiQ (UPF0313 family)
MIGLIDVDGTLPNLALMKISAYFKSLGEKVEFVRPNTKYDKIYASAIFTRSKPICESLIKKYGDRIEIGGTGWDTTKYLPPEIETHKADYSLYDAEFVAGRIRGIMNRQTRLRKAKQITEAGMGFTSRGCVRRCPFCVIPAKEGQLRQAQEIRDIVNPKSNVVILHDNNLTADPNCLEKLREIRERGLIVDINQGCDVRLMTDEIAAALNGVRHLRSLHYAWDLMKHENQVINGIKTLSRFVRPYRHMCFMLTGFDTSFEEDLYRFRKLVEMKIKPYVMVYNEIPDVRLKHFARWVNARIYTKCTFDEYTPWIKARKAGII